MTKALHGLRGEDHSILVTGADGTIGRRLVLALEREGKCVWASTRRQAESGKNRVFIDLAETACEARLPLDTIRSAVLCAAVTSMERCRLEPAATRRINVENTVAVAKRLIDAGIFVVFLSSNTVFDGQTAFPGASDRTNPQTEYGRQKVQAEERLLHLGGEVAVVRFAKVIAPDMPLLSSWARDLIAGKVIYPFSDGVMAPVSTSFVVDLLIRVLAQRLTGIIQASARDDISYETAARYIAAKLAADARLVEPIFSKQAGVAPGPRHTTLDTSRLAEVGLEAPPPTHALDQLTLTAIG